MKKLRFYVLFSLTLILLIPLPVNGQGVRIDFYEYTLENGLHVILHQDNSTPNVVVNIMYHVGSKNENPNLTGFAHYFEHLMFEGTKHIERGEFTEIVEKAGGSLNAWTSFDLTNYFVMMPSNQLELGLWLESERLLHPVIDSIGIATQKSVVTEEMKETRDNRPYGRILSETIKRAFTVHPYRWDVLGKDEHIRNATYEDIVGFHEMFYVPNNAVLVVSGDIDKAKTKPLVEKYFGDIPRGTKEIFRPYAVEPRRKSEIRDTVFDNIQLPAIIHAYPLPARGTKDFYAMDMLSALLTRGESSRMVQRLVNEDQVALTIQAMALGLEDPGLKIVFGLPNMGIAPDVLERGIIKELDRVKNELISEREFQTIRNQIESTFVNSNTTIAQRATNLATNHLLFGDANLINTELENYFAVTREDIQRVAREYLKEEYRVVLYYLPKPQ
ncbi:MAG TPA: pitrilysin family protein [Bacteroidales bacterium]|nr:pitrilysin family protein [Bacteroidales bacterium]